MLLLFHLLGHNTFSLTNMFHEEVVLHINVTRPWSCPRLCIQTKSTIVVLKYCKLYDGGGCKVHIQLGPNLLEKLPQRY